MSKTKLMLVATFALVLSAGVVVGRLWNHLPPPHNDRPANPPSWFADQLELRPEQKQQMDAIWAETKPKMDKSMEQRQSLDRERDQAIQELLTPAEWTAYDKIIEDFRAKRGELDKQRHQLVQDANEKSMALLDNGQKQKWEAFRSSHDHDRRGPHGPGGPGGSGPDGAASRGSYP